MNAILSMVIAKLICTITAFNIFIRQNHMRLTKIISAMTSTGWRSLLMISSVRSVSVWPETLTNMEMEAVVECSVRAVLLYVKTKELLVHTAE